jgi:hypothetical protein
MAVSLGSSTNIRECNLMKKAQIPPEVLRMIRKPSKSLFLSIRCGSQCMTEHINNAGTCDKDNA